MANLTSQLAANTQAVLNREAQAKSGYAMPWMSRPQTGGALGAERVEQGGKALDQAIRGDGGLHAMGSSSGFVGRSSSQLYQQSRFGFDPPAQLKEISEWACMETLQACGVAPVLFSDTVEASREAHRRFLSLTAQPLADKIASELGRVLEAEVLIDLTQARTSDEITGRARAVGSLVQAGLLLDDALTEAGLTESEGRAAPTPVFTPTSGGDPSRPRADASRMRADDS